MPSAADRPRPGSESWTDPIRDRWESVPPNRRRDLERVIGGLPANLRQWRGLLEAGLESIRLSAGDRRRVVIAGPPNAGKSTLYNRLILGREAKAVVGPEPGTTTVAQEGDGGVFSLVDTPGADVERGEMMERALEAARRGDVIVVVFDGADGLTPDRRALLGDLLQGGQPWVVAINKMDAVRQDRAAVVGRAAEALGIAPEEIVPISARTGAGLERLLTEIARREPEIVVALGQALPAYRDTLARAAIRRAASTAAAIALTPLPMIAFVPLVGVQSALVLGLARIYDYRITVARAREIIVTFGIGLLGRTLFHELVKLGGPPGWLLAASVAAGTTAALGYAAAAWFARGERLSRHRLQGLSRRVGRAVVSRLRSGRRPARDEVRRQVGIVLEDTLTPEGEAPADGGL